MSVLEENTKRLDAMVDELALQPDLVAELNIKFSEMDGRKNKDEFSRCLVFFFYGRLYERKLSEMERS